MKKIKTFFWIIVAVAILSAGFLLGKGFYNTQKRVQAKGSLNNFDSRIRNESSEEFVLTDGFSAVSISSKNIKSPPRLNPKSVKILSFSDSKSSKKRLYVIGKPSSPGEKGVNFADIARCLKSPKGQEHLLTMITKANTMPEALKQKGGPILPVINGGMPGQAPPPGIVPVPMNGPLPPPGGRLVPLAKNLFLLIPNPIFNVPPFFIAFPSPYYNR